MRSAKAVLPVIVVCRGVRWRVERVRPQVVQVLCVTLKNSIKNHRRKRERKKNKRKSTSVQYDSRGDKCVGRLKKKINTHAHPYTLFKKKSTLKKNPLILGNGKHRGWFENGVWRIKDVTKYIEIS